MSTNNIENKTINEQNGEECQQIVIETQPKTGETQQQKQKLSSTEELALLGLRPNSAHSDPCLCFCCIFCMEAFMTPGGGAPPIKPHKKMERKALGFHNWDNDSHYGDHDEDGLDWAVSLANHLSDGHGGHGGDGGHDGDCGGDGGGDGGGCGGGDGGGGD